MITVKELKGYKSLRALNAFSALVLGLKMLPAYMEESYEDFLSRLKLMPESDQRKMLSQAAQFVELQNEEIEAIICFVVDENGVPYSSENIKNLGPDELINIVVEVCMRIVKIKIDFVSDSEKKN